MPVCGPRAPFLEKECKHHMDVFHRKKNRNINQKKRNVICFGNGFTINRSRLIRAEPEKLRRRCMTSRLFPQTRKICVASDDDRLSRQTANDSASRRELWKFRDFLRSHNEWGLINILNLARLERKPRRWWKEFFAFSCEKHSSSWFHWWDLMIVHRWGDGDRGGAAFRCFSRSKVWQRRIAQKAITLMILVGRAETFLSDVLITARRKKQNHNL